MADDKNYVKVPSTAHLDSRGQYIHDPLNQHYAEQEKQGKLAPQDRGQQRHGVRPGYCPQHSRLGCEVCA
jgi:hypothetical protein